MTIVDRLTPTQYKLRRFAVQVADDGGLSLHSDIAVYNATGRQVGVDHPEPQATPAELNAFQAWLERNLAAYEAVTGLIELIGEE